MFSQPTLTLPAGARKMTTWLPSVGRTVRFYTCYASVWGWVVDTGNVRLSQHKQVEIGVPITDEGTEPLKA